jgi:uncharacterized Rossmann fold enzyme
MCFKMNILHQNIIKAIKSKKIRWAQHILPMREMRNAYKILEWESEG